MFLLFLDVYIPYITMGCGQFLKNILLAGKAEVEYKGEQLEYGQQYFTKFYVYDLN